MIVLFLVLCCFVLSSGCATLGEYNPATGKKEFILIPTDSEVDMGKSIHQQIIQEFGSAEEGPQAAYIKLIGARVARISDRQDYTYHFYLLKAKELNAFTTPGGNVYFFQGLLDKLDSDDEIAAVLAHEIGHCAARHTIKKYQASLGYNLIGSLIFSQVKLGETAKQTASLAANTAVQLAMTAYSRHDEYEADRLGIKYMYLAGYRLDGMINTLEILKKASQGSKPPLILSTHPYVEDRIKVAKAKLAWPRFGRLKLQITNYKLQTIFSRFFITMMSIINL